MLTKKEENVLRLIQDNVYQNYFFQKVKDLKWFDSLNKRGFFKPNQIKFQKKTGALFWNVLDYLERVSEQVARNPQYGKEIIDIIKNIVQFSKDKKRINNYHIWWYCVKILNNLPPKIIQDNLPVDEFRIWLSAWTDYSMGSDLTISDIGEKLLPKFLKDEYRPEYKYAEAIIEVITGIMADGKGRRKAMSRREDAILEWDSYWIRKAFDKNASLVGQNCSLGVLFSIADKLKRALEYKQKQYRVNIDIGDDVYQMSVARQSEDGLKQKEIAYKEGVYECFVKQFSQEQLKGVDREKDFWALHNIEPQIELKSFSFIAPTRDLFVTAIRGNLPADIKWESTDKLEEKIESIYKGLYSDYSHIWCRSLKSGPEYGDGAEDILSVILRDVLLAKCEASRKDGKQALRGFLSDKYQFPIFRRLVLLCVDNFWTDYSELLMSLIAAIPNILEESDFEVEMQDLLQHHNAPLSPALTAKLKDLIDDVPEYYIEKGEKLTAYWRYKWLSPLRDNPDFSALYEDAKQKAELKDGKPYEPERSAFKGGFITHKSPISKDEILKKPIAELVKQLGEFKGTDFWHGSFEGEPDREGFAEALRLAVKDEPKKFTDEISAFNDVNYFYLHNLFRGFSEAWNSNKEIDWKKIFDFVLQYFNRDKEVILKEAFQAQGEDSGKGKYIWLIEDIVDLIEDGSRDDKHAFGAEHLNTVKQIFDAVIPFPKAEKRPDTERDALTYALNTTFGRIVMSFIVFSLRVARATKKREQDWGENNYERFFDKGIEAYIWFGRYLPNLRYLDEKYVDNKISKFSERNIDDYEWQMFMDGYLTGSHVYADIYQLMRPNYSKALQKKIASEHVDNRLVQHITIGYLGGSEELKKKNSNEEDSLFWKMLDEAGTPEKRDRWLEVVSYFWSISGRTIRKEGKEEEERLSGKERERVLEFWKWSCEESSIEYVKSRLGKDYGSFLGRLAELTILLEQIDETAEKWLMLSAPFVDEDRRSGFFIEYLTKFEDEDSIKRIGKILLRVLGHTTPTFRQEEIQLLVKRLFNLWKKYPEKYLEAKEAGNNICDTYGRRGIHFLKDIWAEYNK